MDGWIRILESLWLTTSQTYQEKKWLLLLLTYLYQFGPHEKTEIERLLLSNGGGNGRQPPWVPLWSLSGQISL